jgi:Fe-S oxidoreductase
MVTLEEEHSTRGRAHMLFEMLQGEVVREGWQDEHVKKALDLCLSCKACKSECPANVDLATTARSFWRITTKASAALTRMRLAELIVGRMACPFPAGQFCEQQWIVRPILNQFLIGPRANFLVLPR